MKLLFRLHQQYLMIFILLYRAYTEITYFLICPNEDGLYVQRRTLHTPHLIST